MDARSKLWEAAGRGRVRVRAELPNYLQSPLSLSLAPFAPFRTTFNAVQSPFGSASVRSARPSDRDRDRSPTEVINISRATGSAFYARSVRRGRGRQSRTQ